MPADFSAIRELYHITGNHGFSTDEISVHKNVCENLPKVLVDYYQQFGKCEFNQTIDNLLNPDELWLSDNILAFYQKSERVCDWGIATHELNLDNPPVWIGFDEDWYLTNALLNDFLVAMAHWQAMFALPFCKEEFLVIQSDKLDFIENNFKQKPFYLPHEQNIYFYGNTSDEVISLSKSMDVYILQYASYTQAQFEKLDEMLGELGE